MFGLETSGSLHTCSHLGRENFGVSVDTRHKTHADGSPECLGNFALVDRSETSDRSGFDTAHAGHILGHNGEVL